MKLYSKLSAGVNDSIEFPMIRGRSNTYKSTIPKLRNNSSSFLNNSAISNTTECSLLKVQDSFSINGKPPKVPMLRTVQVRQKEKNDTFLLEIDEKYYFSEFKKHEIIQNRQMQHAQSPFWYINPLNTEEAVDRKTKENSRHSSFTLDDIEIAKSERSDFNKWLCSMQEKLFDY